MPVGGMPSAFEIGSHRYLAIDWQAGAQGTECSIGATGHVSDKGAVDQSPLCPRRSCKIARRRGVADSATKPLNTTHRFCG